jgi:hypothetical protein
MRYSTIARPLRPNSIPGDFTRKIIQELNAKGPAYKKKWLKDNRDATPSDFYDHQIKEAWEKHNEKA